MKQRSTQSQVGMESVIGIDLGDRWSYWYELDWEGGECLGEGRVRTSRASLAKLLKDRTRARVVIEVGAQSAWIGRLIESLGHEVIVANARQVELISRNVRKSDRVDAETLARLGRVDPLLLRPIAHRSESVQQDRSLLAARDVLVECRTRLINHARGTVKLFGERLPKCASTSFANKVRSEIPDDLRAGLSPLVDLVEALTTQIRAFDRQIERRCQEAYPITECLRQVQGVGPLTSLAFVLTIEDPGRFAKSRQVGPYLGLVPGRRQSGQRDPDQRITRCGDPMTRRLLVQSAHYILGPFGPDTDLRRYGQRVAAHGGQHAKSRAVIAVARKLAVLLHRLMKTGEVYDPLYATHLQESAA